MLSKQEKRLKNLKKAREARKLQLINKGKKTYLNRNWLFSRRCIDKLSLDDIAEMCKVEYDVIWDSLKRLEIPIIIMVGREQWCDWVSENETKISYVEVK